MPRENAASKGRRLLVEGRLVVDLVNGHRISATCRGDSAEVYNLGHEPGRWYCSCPAIGRCELQEREHEDAVRYAIGLRALVDVGEDEPPRGAYSRKEG